MTSQVFGQICKKARLMAGLTQSQLAKKTGIHVNYYSRIERGEVNPSFDKINKILKILKVEITLP